MSSLPIESVLPDIRAALANGHEVILEAPPGAGKTTQVPLALLDAPWLGKQKILMLEPRRLAARAAAGYMASLCGETVGQTIGYRVRLDTKVSSATRIEVVTEGILTRMLQEDPALQGIGLLIFDEFHERNLDADLGLALSLQGRELFRETQPLKLLLMSATLEDANLSKLLANAPVIRSEGRTYPVSIHYGEPWRSDKDIFRRVVQTIHQALREDTGSLLVFLPGQREIRQVYEELEPFCNQQSDFVLAPLYGDLNLNQQRQAIAPAAAGKRKIVLATDIAETSLTIEGIHVVIDAGLSRVALFDATTGMTRLHTRRVSRASSIQRMGRAGRLQAGVCYRLWSSDQQTQLIPYSTPEILQADLVPLAMQLHRWGVDDPQELAWLDPPPVASYAQAQQLLVRLGALEKTASQRWRLTSHGEAMASLPTHPRLAHLLLLGKRFGLQNTACNIAALLTERDPLPRSDADLHQRLALLQTGSGAGIIKRILQQSKVFARLIQGSPESAVTNPEDSHWVGFLLACAYPDRIAQQRRPGDIEYRLSSGRAARLGVDDPLQHASWLAVAQLGGKQGQACERIFLAAPLEPGLFDGLLADLVTTEQHVTWDRQTDRLIAEQQRLLGTLVLSRKNLEDIPLDSLRHTVLELVRKKGLSLLPWTGALRQWQARVLLLRNLSLQDSTDSEWPDVSDAALLETLEDWLGPYVDHIRHINHFAALDLPRIITALLPWPLPKQLEDLAPSKYQVLSGSQIPIDYSKNPPVLAVRIQEMFGCNDSPRIANGRIPLRIHLLSPARRPLQITQDLAHFWRNGYAEVKKEMKGRYPKHYWPDDPLNAKASRGPKRK